MMNQINYRISTNKDLPQIIKLISDSNLPIVDLIEGKQLFVVAEVSAQIIACAGLEIHKENGLFRSLAVSPSYRNMKIGKDIFTKIIALSRKNQIKQLYLLTTTADLYFRRGGWKEIDRTEVPDKIRSTSEFSSVCPSTAMCMKYQLH